MLGLLGRGVWTSPGDHVGLHAKEAILSQTCLWAELGAAVGSWSYLTSFGYVTLASTL